MAGRGQVVELGCGPAHVAAYLAARGVAISGLDLSAGMVAEARRMFPELEVVAGDMMDLPFEARSHAGIVAFYSIIHFDDDQLATVFAEMARILGDGGLVAIAFHIGDEVVHREQWWDMPVVLDARFLPVDLVARQLESASLEIVSSDERGPYAPEVEYQSRRAYIVARRSGRG
jgi:SAM-dependent methyltransferase